MKIRLFIPEIFGALTLVFVIAKILGYIEWAWWKCFAPLIAGLSVGVFILFFFVLLAIGSNWKKY